MFKKITYISTIIFIGLITLTVYQNCAEKKINFSKINMSDTNGNGTPYGGMRSYYNYDKNYFCNKNPQLGYIKSRIVFVDEQYRYYSDLCNSPEKFTVLNSDELVFRTEDEVDLIKFTGDYYQLYSSDKEFDPEYLWITEICNEASGLYYDTLTDEVPIKVNATFYSKNIKNRDENDFSNIEHVNIKLARGNRVKVDVLFDQLVTYSKKILKDELVFDQIVKTSVKEFYDFKLLVERPENLINPDDSDNLRYFLKIQDSLDPDKDGVYHTYFDGPIYCGK